MEQSISNIIDCFLVKISGGLPDNNKGDNNDGRTPGESGDPEDIRNLMGLERILNEENENKNSNRTGSNRPSNRNTNINTNKTSNTTFDISSIDSSFWNNPSFDRPGEIPNVATRYARFVEIYGNNIEKLINDYNKT